MKFMVLESKFMGLEMKFMVVELKFKVLEMKFEDGKKVEIIIKLKVYEDDFLKKVDVVFKFDGGGRRKRDNML